MLQENADKQFFTFTKKERICSKLVFQQLIQKKQNYFKYPLKCYFLVHKCDEERKHSAIAISISKKLHKKAISRNRVKRLVRECWRLNHPVLLDQEKYYYDILFVYIAKEIHPYAILEAAVKDIMNWLNKNGANYEMDH